MVKIPKKLIAISLLVCTLSLCLFSCDEGAVHLSPEKPKITLRIAFLDEAANMYMGSDATLCDSPSEVGEGERELLPFWRELSDLCGFELYGRCVTDPSELSEFDIVIGSVQRLDILAREGYLLDASTYLSSIPSAKERLYENDLIFSYMGESKYNEFGIYAIPTVGNSLEFSLLPYFHEETVRLLLDSEDVEFSPLFADEIFVTHYMPEEGSVTVDVIGRGGELSKLTKNYTTAGNVISLLRLYNGKELTGERAVATLRNYIDKAYGGYYGEERSALFLGESAAYDADELAALLICAAANSALLAERGLPSVLRTETEEEALSVLASIYGVRGHNGGYTYVSHSGELRDSRIEPETYELLDMLSKWKRSGIIEIGENSELGSLVRFGAEREELGHTPSLPPIAKWKDGSNSKGGVDEGVYMRFTESVSFAENLAVGISKGGVVSSYARLDAALKLVETVSSAEGRAAIAAGLKLNNTGALRREAETLGYGNITDYIREELGVCQGLYPINDRVLNEGGDCRLIARALEQGILKTTSTKRAQANNWYRAAPILLPYTAEEYSALMAVIKHNEENSGESFSQLAERIASDGYFGAGFKDKYDLLAYINSIWRIGEYKKLIEDGYYTVGVYYYEYINGIEY
ncbi:MAG: hypothetical protein IJE25_03460 [Clostridia bacterium]|nr:hypothetical protein [Clostridia bacterium]